MADFDRLVPPASTVLTIKLDGYIEACVALAHANHIGLEEALELASAALMREMHARGLDRERAIAIVLAAADQLWPPRAELPLN